MANALLKLRRSQSAAILLPALPGDRLPLEDKKTSKTLYELGKLGKSGQEKKRSNHTRLADHRRRLLSEDCGASVASAWTTDDSVSVTSVPSPTISQSKSPPSTVGLASLALDGLDRDSRRQDIKHHGLKVGRRLNVCSSEKDIYDGSFHGLPSVVCFAKDDTTELAREANIVSRLRGCPHVIKMHAFIDAADACMVLERVQPLGHDLIEVVTQQASSGRPMALGQVRHYMMQLAVACQEMRSRGVVHRDLKPDNVLVDENHTIKVIDFGLAAIFEHEDDRDDQPPEVKNLYSAPEVNRLPVNPAIDVWSMGMILYTLCIGMNANTKQILKWEAEREGIRGCLHGVHPAAVEAIEGLLRKRPSERWSLADLRNWAAQAEIPEMLPVGAGVLQRWPYRENCPQAFGAQLPRGWARSGQTIGQLDLMHHGGVQVLMVDRYCEWQKFYTFDCRGQVTTAYRNKVTNVTRWEQPQRCKEAQVVLPTASTVLYEQDWIYFGVNSNCGCTENLKSVISERLGLKDVVGDLGSLARRPSRSSLIQFLPDFVYFKFPAHCANAVLGQESHAREGQNALNLRKVFGINIAGIVRADGEVSWWPGACEAEGGLVREGDGALVMRVPQWDSRSSLANTEGIADLVDGSLFRRRLELDTDHRVWRAWRSNAGMRVLVRL